MKKILSSIVIVVFLCGSNLCYHIFLKSQQEHKKKLLAKGGAPHSLAKGAACLVLCIIVLYYCTVLVLFEFVVGNYCLYIVVSDLV